MGVSPDYFAILGLTPGLYAPREIEQRFRTEQARALRALDEPRTHERAREELDGLHTAFNALRDQQRQLAELRARTVGEDRQESLRRMIDASLEGGLLRHSRRRDILRVGQALGFSDFHTHLLIAQVQVGDAEMLPTLRRFRPRPKHLVKRASARLAAAGVLALALFLAIVRWLGA